mgnify:CR=1 FL=1
MARWRAARADRTRGERSARARARVTAPRQDALARTHWPDALARTHWHGPTGTDPSDAAVFLAAVTARCNGARNARARGRARPCVRRAACRRCGYKPPRVRAHRSKLARNGSPAFPARRSTTRAAHQKEGRGRMSARRGARGRRMGHARIGRGREVRARRRPQRAAPTRRPSLQRVRSRRCVDARAGRRAPARARAFVATAGRVRTCKHQRSARPAARAQTRTRASAHLPRRPHPAR